MTTDPVPPVGPGPARPPAPPYPYGYQVQPQQHVNGKAIASLVASIALLFACTPLSIIGAILGHVARREIRDGGEHGESGDGLALAGIIIGWIGPALLILGVAVFIVVAFVVRSPA